MEQLFATGRVVDLILLVLVVEIAAIAAWRVRRKIQVRATRLLLAALPGVFLLLALRSALSAGPWMVTALWLAASFPAQLADWWGRRP
jgi:hypothetical protein